MGLCGTCSAKDKISQLANPVKKMANLGAAPGGVSQIAFNANAGQGGWFKETTRHREASYKGKYGKVRM